MLDLLSLSQAARAISSELAPEELQRTLLRILREATGAQYAALLDFNASEGWVVLCQSAGESRTTADLPATVLAEASQTRKSVILSNASAQAPHAQDSVVRARGLRSVLCQPLTHRGRQHGLLYLESTQSVDAFGEARQSLIELLVSQAAVALDNAYLHHDLLEQSRAHESARREAEAARKQMQDIIDHSPAAIYLKDRLGRYLMVNSLFEAFYGVPRARIVGRKDSELLPPENAQALMENDLRVLLAGETLRFEEEIPHHDGPHTFLSAKFPLRTEDGTIHAVCGISTDITEHRKRADLALQKANEELEQRVAERTEQLHAAQRELLDRARHAGMAEIASSILHNLGNALTGISVSSALLRERLQTLPINSLERVANMFQNPPAALGAFLAEDPKARHLPEFLGKLHARFVEERQSLLDECAHLATKVEHANSVIATQQNYARTRFTLRERMRLRELAEDALRLCADSNQFEALVHREYGEEEPEFYERHVVVQILVNLIANAKNAVRERLDNAHPRITVTIHQDSERTLASVTDNGVGFDEAVKARLFTYGFTTRPRGHGFGLHSAALSAQALGGHIEAHSEGPGKGARFEFILPRQRLDAEP
ncbi:PAS domain-containing protein [Hyalangium rubrum]|uniref:histidine kinase n=1 Tax=Hyalangium rubrum TaxID=3103134 RepID=A0ABU5HHR5_9BACT|nr:PAS domain-containing protein [Hyalangium sp. s54d21]MDY7232424.1 PAS domain-containing protein [Hyalangium sp. s54d21]